ncbi:MAG: OsmC family protein [Acidobacteriia bacterium]|nr:OsmC family protein [Terriglobia bacterium]
MSEERAHHVTVSLARKYEFVAEFPDVPEAAAILFDEPAPLGDGRAPNAAAMLGAAVGNCLAASLTFCLRKSRVDVDGVTAHVTTHVAKNEQGKFRISGIDVELAPEFDAADQAKFDRCEHLFEDFCIVTQSVRQGIPVNVTIKEREVAPAS